MPKSYHELLEKANKIQEEIGDLEDDLLSLYAYVLTDVDKEQIQKGMTNERLLLICLAATKARASKSRILIGQMIESASSIMERAGWWGL